MNSNNRLPSMPGRDPAPNSPSGAKLVLVALSFTVILIEVQTAVQGGVHNLLPVLIAALVVLAGLGSPDRPET